MSLSKKKSCKSIFQSFLNVLKNLKISNMNIKISKGWKMRILTNLAITFISAIICTGVILAISNANLLSNITTCNWKCSSPIANVCGLGEIPFCPESSLTACTNYFSNSNMVISNTCSLYLTAPDQTITLTYDSLGFLIDSIILQNISYLDKFVNQDISVSFDHTRHFFSPWISEIVLKNVHNFWNIPLIFSFSPITNNQSIVFIQDLQVKFNTTRLVLISFALFFSIWLIFSLIVLVCRKMKRRKYQPLDLIYGRDQIVLIN